MSNGRQHLLERWRTILLTTGARSTFLTFFVPFISQREPEATRAFSQTLQRLRDGNSAVRAGALLIWWTSATTGASSDSAARRARSGACSSSQNSLKKKGEEEFVRQSMVETLRQIGRHTMTGGQPQGSDLGRLSVGGLDFENAELEDSDLSLPSDVTSGKPGYVPASVEKASFLRADMAKRESLGSNRRQAMLEQATLTEAWLFDVDTSNAFLAVADLSNVQFRTRDSTRCTAPAWRAPCLAARS